MILHNRKDRAPANGKLLGACAGLAARTGLNATLLRVAALVALVCTSKLTIVVYCLAAIAFRADRR